MADRKRTTGRSQAATLKSRTGETAKSVKALAQEERSESTALKSESASVKRETAKSETSKNEAARSAKAPVAREVRREPKQETRTAVRKESKGSSSFAVRMRNNKIGRFVYDAYYELRHKVTWPTPKEARNMTIAVVALTAVVGGIIAVADWGLHQVFLWIIGAK